MESVAVGECDEVLLASYRKGNTEALSILVDRYQNRLFSFIINMAGRPDEADEIFQEVWFRAIDKIDTYREKNFLAWLTRIAHNLVIDRWRGKKVVVSLDATEDEGGLDLSEKLSGPELTPAEQAESNDMVKRILDTVAALPVEQREVFLLRAKADLSFKEIAVIQGVSINTALARMQYALTKLRPLLADENLQQ